MRVGIPTEIKNNEYRVAMTPAGVHELVRHGHEVMVETHAGWGSSIDDDEYAAAGARILGSPDDIWGAADLVCKVKEPVADEYARMRPDQVLFTYLHLAASRECTQALLDSGITGIAYEAVQADNGHLPLLAPMSEVAGRMATQVGAHFLERGHGGRGIVLGGVPGTRAARVVVIGAGVAGMNAAVIAAGMMADVWVVDKDVDRLREVEAVHGGRMQTVTSNLYEVESAVLDADLVIGAVLVPGARAPVLVRDDMVARMRSGSVLVDVAIDQGGCFESSRPTTHDQPTYRVHDSVFYCVANMPGAVPHTSTYALTNVTLPYVMQLADRGWREAMRADPALARGLNTHAGQLTYAPVAETHGLAVTDLDEVLN
ncbi:alanine dehydrogenase [Actinobacteria bacterium YIM 96077]|uniref:Alanine dehydrogenase n=1 Tax=Phytoactinopolyspora halophila TaxID=1981511 RepID=A0A329QEI5_9ACTN|nr:alanine dehydrogenase [Phytoactinopolyspora halophila]AYY13604.1 alanine dehydrogenase [Actinobacteria bacterium YIM 96077]RAW10730.1 alanine dehydrogenase [Phytoactinopolyspora halophila]